ncbi:uncharacterized protein ACWYII_037261 [Salvelinus alpinus]
MAALGLLWLVIATASILVKYEGAKSEDKKIYPAKIFGPSNVTEGVNVHFKCSTTGIRVPEDKFNLYLCKNGVGLKMKVLEKGEDDTIFTMKDVTREDSGNYSCVYTRDKPVHSHLKSTGENLIVFHVHREWKVYYINVLHRGTKECGRTSGSRTCSSLGPPVSDAVFTVEVLGDPETNDKH